MKNKLFFPKTLMIIMTVVLSIFTASAQQNKKIIVVINKAGWCPICQANGEKVMKEVMPVFNESNVQFIMNDLTNVSSKADSKMKLEEAKVYPAVKKITSTGLLLLVDAESGKLLEKISVAEPADKLIMAIKKSSMQEKM